MREHFRGLASSVPINRVPKSTMSFNRSFSKKEEDALITSSSPAINDIP
jgi:hypothetical protein